MRDNNNKAKQQYDLLTCCVENEGNSISVGVVWSVQQNI